MIYSEFDPQAAAWLRELIADGLIPQGVVDERDIREVEAKDLAGHGTFHAFAGIGGWPYALRLAGWPDSRPVWTGSCPCQPFSAAGKRQGEADSRHVWPEFRRLIAECRPPTVFGEQVASDDGCVWLAGVFADLEALGYRVAGADLPAAGVGAPHIRQRLYWVANAGHGERGRANECESGATDTTERDKGSTYAERRGGSRGLADADGGLAGDGGLQRGGQHGQRAEDGRAGGGLGDTGSKGREERIGNGRVQQTTVESQAGQATFGGSDVGGPVAAWSDFIAIPCRDGKWRRVPTQPGFQPLVDGLSASLDEERIVCSERFPLAGSITGRVALLRGAGNAIVPQVAAAFIRAYLEVTESRS